MSTTPQDRGKPAGTAAMHTLPRSFYAPAATEVAQAILGKVLVSRSKRALFAGRIVEVEAYLGTEDPAAHTFRGVTPRNSVLFGPPGHAYVYFIYGMHSCLNVSCEPEGQAGCILIRALEPLDSLAGQPVSLAEMRYRRHLAASAATRLIASGPGRLCQAFDIQRSTHNGIDLTSDLSGLQIVDDGFLVKAIVASPRIGISKAADLQLRFHIEDNHFVSGKK